MSTWVRVASYVFVPLVIGLGAEFLFEWVRRRFRRRAESERGP